MSLHSRLQLCGYVCVALSGRECPQNALPGAVPKEKPQDGYVSAGTAEEKQVVDVDRISHAASYMEMTVPLLHEAMPARTLLTDMSRVRRPQVWTPPFQARSWTVQGFSSCPDGRRLVD